MWRRYVAIGDSFTEGLEDADSATNSYVGWADRLAEHLAAHAEERRQNPRSEPTSGPDPSFGYANLAVRGRLLADITGPQVDRALVLGPDLVSIVAGGNDLLRLRFDMDALAGRLDQAVARIRDSGADVLIATPVDPREAPLVRRLRGRMADWTANIWSIAYRHDAYVLDQWSLTALRDARLWAPDRIHLSSEGHRRVASATFAALGLAPARPPAGAPDWAVPLPPMPTPSRLRSAQETAVWAKEYLRPWVRRRLRHESSGDLVEPKRPELAAVRDATPSSGPG